MHRQGSAEVITRLPFEETASNRRASPPGDHFPRLITLLCSFECCRLQRASPERLKVRPSDEVDALRSAPVLLFFFSSFLSSFFFLRTGHRRVGGRCQVWRGDSFLGQEKKEGRIESIEREGKGWFGFEEEGWEAIESVVFPLLSFGFDDIGLRWDWLGLKVRK